MNSNWKPNDKQVAFMGALKEKGMTLREASKVLGFEVKSGTVNTLVTKGLVSTIDKEVRYNKVDCETGEVIGTGKTSVKVYSLVAND